MSEAYIVAGGPSLTNFKWDRLLGKFVIAINRSLQVLPFADIVYFTDYQFWKAYKKEILAHDGKKIRGWMKANLAHDNTTIEHPDVTQYQLSRSNKLEEKPGMLAHGSNSTYAAINLCFHLGFKKIYLLGLDMKKSPDKTTHWHSGYSFRNPVNTYTNMAHHFPSIVQPLKKHGIKVININNNTALTCFPVVSYEEIFGDDCFGLTNNDNV